MLRDKLETAIETDMGKGTKSERLNTKSEAKGLVKEGTARPDGKNYVSTPTVVCVSCAASCCCFYLMLLYRSYRFLTGFLRLTQKASQVDSLFRLAYLLHRHPRSLLYLCTPANGAVKVSSWPSVSRIFVKSEACTASS